MKTFKQFFYENKEYQVDDSQQEEYLEYQSEFVYDYEAMMGLPHDKLASIISKTGNKRFSATIDGVDPSVDGTEHYYVVTDRDVLKNIASLIASTDEPHHEEFAMDVGTSDSFEFMVRLPKSGFTGEEIGEMEVFLVAPGGSDQLHALLTRVEETKSAPAGHYFTKKGNLVKGRLTKAARERGATKSDPKDKQRSKVPPVSQVREGKKKGLWHNINAKKERGGKSARKGSKAYKAAVKAGDKLEATKNENFKDGKKKGKSRPGRVKRAGASCSGSVTSLRKKAKAGGEKGKMYHWCANMKSGKKKK